MRPEHQALISRYASGGLTAAEEAELLKAAMDDQELFDVLFVEDGLRAILERPEYRQRLIRAASEAEMSRFSLAWLRRPLGVAVAAVAVVGVGVGVLVMSREPLGPAYRGIDVGSGPAAIFRIPPANEKHARLVLDRSEAEPSYHMGEPIRLGFKLDFDGQAFLLEEDSAGIIHYLYPTAGASPLVRGGEDVLVPAAGAAERKVGGPLGPRRLRLLAIRVGEKLRLDDHRLLEKSAGNGALVERSYRVVP